MSPSSADQVVVGSLFQEYCATEYPGDNPDEVFERYAATQILKPYELTADELAVGIVDGPRDGGVDGFYVFLNGSIVSADDAILKAGDPAVSRLGSHPELEVFLIQSKNRERWEESAWEHLLSSLTRLLATNADDAALEALYRPEVVEQTGIIRRAMISLASKFPKVSFNVRYVTRALERNVTDTLEAQRKQVEELSKSLLTTGASVSVEHIGVEELYRLAGTEPARAGVLRFRNLIREPNSFLGVVSLGDYLEFVRNGAGVLREELFESNVRDYEGDNIVNESILNTLQTNDQSEFWWLNNGVTILGDKVDSPQNTLTISRPLIVNGLQTSHVLHRADREGILDPQRVENGVVVRVIESIDEDTRDRIIAGTNRQTRVPSPSLYATQPLQRDIERFLHVHGWYYERRKNRYKNQGKPAKRRVTIGLLAQALITLKVGQPDAARARPSTLLSRKDGYDTLFPLSMDLNVYLAAIEIVKEVDEFLVTEEARSVIDERTNARFYVAAGYAVLKLRVGDIRDLRFEQNCNRLSRPLDRKSLKRALDVLASAVGDFQHEHPKMSRDSVFKSGEFRDFYFSELIKQFL